MTLQEKPDFENEEIGGWVDLYAMLHSLYDRNTQPQVVNDALKQRFESLWSSHVEPLQKEITEAVKIAEGFQSERDSYKRIAYKQKTEIESLQSEITRLNLELDSFAIEFTNWISDNNWEGSDMVGVWEKVIDPYFSKALTTAELLELYKETMNTKKD